ncbi:MAG: sigma-E processing peptidase SpoIIGA [Syntrophomonadales bacterium]|jgi:stage II sporulation protein GA (sporulation sigma-E factor processing peptidase)
MSQTPVYIDVILVVNLVMDFLVLWATGKLAGVRIVYRRLLAASVLGAVYSVGSVFSDLSPWYDFPVKVIISGLIVILAFWPGSGQVFLKVWGYFYGVSFAMAGAVVGVSYLFRSYPLGSVPDFSYLWLGGGVVCALALGAYGDRVMKERVVPNLLKCPVGLRFGSAWCQGQGFIDTGNNLTDPLTNKPVVVAEYELISGCFPVDVREAVDYCQREENLFEALAQTSWAHRLRVIPFTSIGKKHGLLVGLRSDELKIQAGNQWLSYPGVVIGLYREPLSPEGSFQMLIPASFVKR